VAQKKTGRDSGAVAHSAPVPRSGLKKLYPSGLRHVKTTMAILDSEFSGLSGFRTAWKSLIFHVKKYAWRIGLRGKRFG